MSVTFPQAATIFCAISLLSDMCSLNLHNNDNDNNNNKRHKWKNAKGMVVHCFCTYGGVHYCTIGVALVSIPVGCEACV